MALTSSPPPPAASGDEDEEEDLSENFLVKACTRLIPTSAAYDGDK